MNRSLRKRSSYLVLLILFVASLAVAYELFLPVFPVHLQHTSPPDTTYSSQTPSFDSTYQKMLASITELFNQQRYEECMVVLKKAKALKPDVPSIQERIIRVEGLIAQQKKTQEEYSRLISMADAYFVKKDYLNAKASYQMAIDTKPDDVFAREKMNQTMELLRSNKAQNILYDVNIASADKLFASEDYDKAKSQYENASKILPGEAYPKEKINAIIKILVDQQVREELYQQAITNADNFYTSKSYQRALLEYQKALQQKAAEPYPQERINELTKILADLAAMEEAYKDAITRADQLFAETRYPDARSGYEEALVLKPKEVYPAQRISEIDGILARIAKNNADFEKFVNLADSFYIDKNFIRARQNYQLALQIKPNESYPKAMLSKTTAGVGEQKANEMAMEEAYNLAIANADRLFAEQAFPEAKAEYENALAVKPDEAYPQQKISEIGTLLAAALARQQELDAQYTLMVENAAREEKLESDYNTAIIKGDSLLELNAYLPAKGAYQAALSLKPAELYPASKITDIDAILEEYARMQTLNQQYEEAITKADQFFTNHTWEQAKTTYQQAQKLKPEELYPAQQLVIIGEKLNEIAWLRAQDQAYQEKIVAAEKFFTANAYDSARVTFTVAQTLKPTESLPGVRISQIDSILLAIVNQKALDEEYAALIASSDKLIAKKEYYTAKEGYNQALLLKPTESYPAAKVAEIEGILAENERIVAFEAKYSQAIINGDSLLSADLFTDARSEFEMASGLKPGELYPKTKLAEIDAALQDIARQQLLDKRYQEEVGTGDRLFADKSWDPAIAAYQSAQVLKPSEKYPGQKLRQIDSIKQEIARQLQIDKDYNSMITHADQLFSTRSFDSARVEYTQAGNLRPQKSYWQEQIAEIDRIQVEIKRVNDEYQAAITSADLFLAEKRFEDARDAFQNASLIKTTESYPREKIKEINNILAEIQGRRQTFDKLVINGDQLFSVKEYFKARENFQQALDLFPDEEHSKEQLRLSNVKIDSIYRANKADYDKAVGEGNGFFNTYEYDKAIDAFTRAVAFLPNEDYPRQMIAKIRKTISENAIADVLNTTILIKAGEEQKFPFVPVNIASRRNNFIYLKVKNLSDNSFNILMRYGNGDQTSGGLAIRNITPDGEVNERLISVKDQDPWYREDNNWISLYPQGGDVEVSFIQVSRAIK